MKQTKKEIAQANAARKRKLQNQLNASGVSGSSEHDRITADVVKASM
jgi:hypothetical protein